MTENKSADAVFKYFYEISKIPRGSGNTKAVSDYCIQVAKEAGLWCRQDEFNNVIIRKPASKAYENRPSVIIQGHLDMVCEKEDGYDFDFTKNGIELIIDGDFITANKTTLGADNGIAVSYALAILTDNSIEAPELEVILSADEETGMDGAIGLDTSDIKGRILLNVDCEDEGVFTVSCAGGINTETNLSIRKSEETLNVMTITVSGLTGGHSGVEIDKKRANSNVLISKLLYELSNIPTVKFISADGGHKLNAIASKSVLKIAFSENEELIKNTISEFSIKMIEKYKETDPEIEITAEEDFNKKVLVCDEDATKNIASLLSSLPDGVFSMSEDIEGLVKTSSNFGILKTDDDVIFILISVRSSEEREKTLLANKISAIVSEHKGTTSLSGDYPAWEYRKNSHLRDVMSDVYYKMYGKKAKTEAIHAGLECGIFSGKLDNLDCVSFGPDMFDIHTPNERLSISSAKRTWEFILEILKNI